MRYYIRQGEGRVVLQLFKAEGERYKKLEQKWNEIIAQHNGVRRSVFDAVMNGGVAQMKTENYLNIYSKSLRGDFVQESHFVRLNGEWEALSHRDVTSPKLIEFNDAKYVYVYAASEIFSKKGGVNKP